ncbi:MAG: acetyl-CoA decarbonylase/synthase complex subunit gamma [Candidatus Methanofastidiosia archaeon]
MAKKLGPLDLYRKLPKTNCGECGEKTCMAFASQLIERKYKPKDCPYLKEKPLEELTELLSPAIRQVEFGLGKNIVKIGGEDVMYRHELTYFNQTAIALDVHDEMSDEELLERVKFVSDFSFERVGEKLTLDAVAIRNKSQDAEKFASCVERVSKATEKALILCSFGVEAMDRALNVCGGKRPLVYTATHKTWEEMGSLALEHNCPVVAFAENDLSELKSMVNVLQNLGLKEICIDPGSNPQKKGFADTFSNFVMARRAGIQQDDMLINCPLIGIPAAAYLEKTQDDELKEVMLGAAMIDRFCDLIIIHSIEVYSILPLITLRQNIYTDPRKPKGVDAGLYEFGEPDENSPVLMTTNFALTYYTVESDIQAGNLDCFLLVVDTDSYGVDTAVAGGQLTSLKVKELIEETKIADRVRRKRLIIPGLAARLSGEIEQVSGWEVLVGPRDSSQIPGYVDKMLGEK